MELIQVGEKTYYIKNATTNEIHSGKQLNNINSLLIFLCFII